VTNALFAIRITSKYIKANGTIGIAVKIQLISNRCLLIIISLLLSNNIIAQDFRTKEKLIFKNEFRYFIEGALHKGTDNTENIPLYERNGDFFYNGVVIEVVQIAPGSAFDNVFKDKIEAGGYFRGSFGAEFPVAENLAFSTAAGFLYDEVTGELGDGSGRAYASFRTTQIDFIGFYMYKRHRIGLGGSFHYNPKFDYKENGNNFQMHGVYRFSNAIGAVIQYDYLVSQNTSLGIRYTNISYDFENVSISDIVNGSGNNFTTTCAGFIILSCDRFIDASSISAHLTYRF